MQRLDCKRNGVAHQADVGTWGGKLLVECCDWLPPDAIFWRIELKSKLSDAMLKIFWSCTH